jgi:signal-transduction protein with cAMP-binding, CBS, and nucleotidyltransferase domain
MPDELTVEGFITDRDIVVQAVALDLSPREVTVGDVMTPVVATIGEQADLHEALEMMRGAGIRRLPSFWAQPAGPLGLPGGLSRVIHRKSTGYTTCPAFRWAVAPYLVFFS